MMIGLHLSVSVLFFDLLFDLRAEVLVVLVLLQQALLQILALILVNVRSLLLLRALIKGRDHGLVLLKVLSLASHVFVLVLVDFFPYFVILLILLIILLSLDVEASVEL